MSELSAIKEILGLKESIDYSDKKNILTLRYNNILCLSDTKKCYYNK